MSFIEKVWQTQHKLEERFKRIGRGQYGRVLRLARKPTTDEFVKSSWVVGIGTVSYTHLTLPTIYSV